MKIDIKDLKKKLQSLKFAMKKSDIDGYGSHIYVTDRMIYTFNGYIKIACPFDYDMEFAVPADDFIKFISKSTKGEIEIELQEDNLFMKSGSTTLLIVNNKKLIRGIIDLPLTPTEFKRLPSRFIDGLKMCVKTYSNNDLLNNPNIFVKDDVIASTDSMRVSEYIFDESFDREFLIPGKIAKEIIKYNMEYYSMEDQIIHFSSSDDIVFSVVQKNDNFPNYKRLFNILDGFEFTFPDTFKAVVDKIKGLSDGELYVTVGNGLIKCVIEGDGSKIEDECICDSENDFGMKVNSRNLSEALEITTEVSIDLKHTAILFEDDHYAQIITVWEI